MLLPMGKLPLPQNWPDKACLQIIEKIKAFQVNYSWQQMQKTCLYTCIEAEIEKSECMQQWQSVVHINIYKCPQGSWLAKQTVLLRLKANTSLLYLLLGFAFSWNTFEGNPYRKKSSDHIRKFCGIAGAW